MLGLMQHYEMTVDEFLVYAERWHGGTGVVSRGPDGAIEQSNYASVAAGARRISSALLAVGVQQGDRIATLAANTARHLECWYGIVGIGCVCHTLNPRMAADQLGYIIDHAEDRVIFVEVQYLPLLQSVPDQIKSVEHIVVIGGPIDEPSTLGDRLETLEAFLRRGGVDCNWGGFDEQLACGLCYTSGTTGRPKGVLYSHRSNYLHTLMGLQPDLLGLSVADVVMPIVPMFHANAWGLVYAAPAVGAKLVLPGSRLDPASLFELMETEAVTLAAAVPTVWLAFLEYLRGNKLRPSALRRVIVGGAAIPASVINGFEQEHGIEVAHLWGMTEVSPIGSTSRRDALQGDLPKEQRMALRMKQGRCPIGVDLQIKDDAGRQVPHDGRSCGNLLVRGRTVAARYFRQDEGNLVDEAGYFDTGDVATIDERGYMQITDRAKDLIKSGGEWISSVTVECIALRHASVALAAVIAMPHPRWGERPLLVIQAQPGRHPAKEELLQQMRGELPRWWLPDDVVFIEQMPLGATGKIDKRALRSRLAAGELI